MIESTGFRREAVPLARPAWREDGRIGHAHGRWESELDGRQATDVTEDGHGNDRPEPWPPKPGEHIDSMASERLEGTSPTRFRGCPPLDPTPPERDRQSVDAGELGVKQFGSGEGDPPSRR